MTKVHLLWKKEEITPDKMDDDKVAVVFDVLFATSTITACLANGAKQVTPVMNETEALWEAKKYGQEDVCLSGELNGITIDGFIDPLPSVLKNHVPGKKLILSTTNGTVAIRKAASARAVYIASLLNARAVAERVKEMHGDSTVVVVCSGSKNQFSIEDFYGAGYFINELAETVGEDIQLTDSALAAKLFYSNMADQTKSLLYQSRIGQMLDSYGLHDDLQLISEKDKFSIVPRLVGGRTIDVEEKKTVAENRT